MATSLSELYFPVGKLLVKKDSLPDDIIPNINASKISVSIGKVKAAGDNSAYPIDTKILYDDSNIVELNVGGKVYDIIDESHVQFAYIPSV